LCSRPRPRTRSPTPTSPSPQNCSGANHKLLGLPESSAYPVCNIRDSIQRSEYYETPCGRVCSKVLSYRYPGPYRLNRSGIHHFGRKSHCDSLRPAGRGGRENAKYEIPDSGVSTRRPAEGSAARCYGSDDTGTAGTPGKRAGYAKVRGLRFCRRRSWRDSRGNRERQQLWVVLSIRGGVPRRKAVAMPDRDGTRWFSVEQRFRKSGVFPGGCPS